MSSIKILSAMFPPRDKKVMCVLLVASILVSFIEMVSISVLMAFIALTTNFNLIESNRYCKMVYEYGAFTHPRHFVVIVGACLLIFFGIRALFNVIYLYYISKFAQMKQHYFAVGLFRHYIQLPYRLFIEQNSAELFQMILSYSTNIAQIITSFLSLCTEFFTVVLIYSMLLYVSWKMTGLLTCFLILQVTMIIRPLAKQVTAAGQLSRTSACQAGDLLGASFWNFKYLKLINGGDGVGKKFDEHYRSLAGANMVYALLEGMPRFILETTGFCLLISVMMYVIHRHYDLTYFIPIVSMYALAFYRFMPSLNKMVGCYNKILFNLHVLEPVHHFFKHETEKTGSSEITFQHQIALENVLFHYSSEQIVLHNVALTIKKGAWIGFVGESGSGKSTLVDIIMGFFTPQQGSIKIDNRLLDASTLCSWRSTIGYIPQTVFLFDGTVADNIVCGRIFDEGKLIEVLKRAHIYDFLQQKDGFMTQVGEGGICLSGGQKQRIALARALYGEPEMLVLDEATSALDTETECNIMNEIYAHNRDKTLLIIAHRLSTLDQCDQIYSVQNGEIRKVRDIDPVRVYVGDAPSQ